MRSVIASGLIATSLCVCPGAGGEVPDYPTYGTASTASEAKRLEFRCLPTPLVNAKVRLHCTFLQTVISSRTAAAEKELADAEREFNREPTAFMKQACGTTPASTAIIAEWNAAPDGPEKAFYLAFISACKAAAPSQVFKAFADFSRQVEAHRCAVDVTSREENFTQADANTWIANLATEGACHIVYVDTLWRDRADNTLWNYRTVATQAGSATDPACKAVAGTRIDDFLWKNLRIRDLGCRFFSL